MESLDGCSKPPGASMDPCEVPEGTEDWLSMISMQDGYLIDGPTIGTGALDIELRPKDVGNGSSDLIGDGLGLHMLGEVAEASEGGPVSPDTRT